MTEEEFAIWLGRVIRDSPPAWMGVPQEADWDTEEQPGGARTFTARMASPEGVTRFRVTVEDITGT